MYQKPWQNLWFIPAVSTVDRVKSVLLKPLVREEVWSEYGQG